MVKIIILFQILFFLLVSSASAKLKVAATYPYIADLAMSICGDKAEVNVLASGNWDPHYVVPKPSLIAKVRSADLLLMNGAELEIGWLPPIIRGARNAKVRPGSTGLVDLSGYVKLIDVKEVVSRSEGDVHPSGNPHFSLDPENIIIIAGVIAKKVSSIDPDNMGFYMKNLEIFKKGWKAKLRKWEAAMKPLKGSRIIQYHRIYDYFCKRYGIVIAAELEPLPGIAPTSGHISKVIKIVKLKKIEFIFNDVYHSVKPARLVSGRTGVKVVIIPHDVNAVPEARDITSLFDEIVGRITK